MDISTNAAVSDADEREIRDLVSRAQEAQTDLDALLAMHTRDAVIVNLAGRRVLGREAFAEAMSAALASPLSDVTTTLEVIDIRPVRPDVAIASCVKTVHDGRSATDTPSALPSTGALTYVMTKESNGRWYIALAQTTPAMTG